MASTSEATTNPTLVSRYGAPKRSMDRRAKRIVIAIAVIVAVVLTAWVAFLNRGNITTKDIGFTVHDSTMTTVNVDVQVPAGSHAQCGVQALSERFAIVGYEVIDVDGDDPDDATRAVTLRTESLAVSGGIERCWMVT